MDAVGGELLVALPGIAGDADRADDLAVGIADQQAAGFGKQLLVARRDQIAHEDRPLLGALMHQARAAPERERRIGFAERHLETDHGGAVFLLEGFHLAARLDHDDADRAAVELGAARDGGIDDAVGLRHCDRSHGRKLIGNPSGAVLCHLPQRSAICRTSQNCIQDMWRGLESGLDARPPLPLPPPRQRATCAPMHAPAPPIAIERLVKIYKTVPAVDGISFTLTPGSVTGLLGGNGAGKTTTIASIMGLTTPTSGRVTVLGAEMPRQRYQVLHRMNFESPYVAMPMRLTIRQNLTVFGMLYGVPDLAARIKQLGEELDLTDLLDRQTGKLSDGQKTRVALAKGLINAPELLLLDEPTASLDPDTADWVRGRLERYRRERNATMLIASHNMAEVERLCDRVIIMKRGHIEDDDTPAKLLARYGRRTLEEVFLDVARGRGIEREAAQ